MRISQPEFLDGRESSVANICKITIKNPIPLMQDYPIQYVLTWVRLKVHRRQESNVHYKIYHLRLNGAEVFFYCTLFYIFSPSTCITKLSLPYFWHTLHLLHTANGPSNKNKPAFYTSYRPVSTLTVRTEYSQLSAIECRIKSITYLPRCTRPLCPQILRVLRQFDTG